MAKPLTVWKANPDAEANLYVYDSASKTYDSATDTYDGIVAGEQFSTEKQPETWTEY